MPKKWVNIATKAVVTVWYKYSLLKVKALEKFHLLINIYEVFCCRYSIRCRRGQNRQKFSLSLKGLCAGKEGELNNIQNKSEDYIACQKAVSDLEKN